MNLRLEEISKIIGARLLQGQPKGEVHGVSTDTRILARGEIFFALCGENFDGHNFLREAFEKGAAAAVISLQPSEPIKGVLLLVPDTLRALGALAADWRRRFELPVIAVTGSVGKTTTKEMIACILCQRGKVLKTPENFNNEIGVPLTVLQLTSEHTAAVFELAMRGSGQIRYLAEIVAPTVGVITNIGLSHLELLSSPTAIAAAKAELLEALGKGGWAVLPEESEHFFFLKTKADRILSFGLNQGDVRAEKIQPEGDRVKFTLSLPTDFSRPEKGRTTLAARLPVPGRHNVLNALAAAAAAGVAGANAEQILRGLMSFSSVPGRMRIIYAPAEFIILDDTYNASPDSVRAALGVLLDLPGERKIAILGEMRELGPESATLHRAIGRQVAALPLDLIIAVGELGREIADSAAEALSSAAIQWVPDAPAALKLVSSMIKKGDVVLAKASRAIGMEVVVSGLAKKSVL